MSGGVDSSATAALLLEQGYDVVGITLKLWPQDCVSRAEDKCCGPQAVTDARAVCHKLVNIRARRGPVNGAGVVCRSADLQSAVSRISNPQPADYNSATQ